MYCTVVLGMLLIRDCCLYQIYKSLLKDFGDCCRQLTLLAFSILSTDKTRCWGVVLSRHPPNRQRRPRPRQVLCFRLIYTYNDALSRKCKANSFTPQVFCEVDGWMGKMKHLYLSLRAARGKKEKRDACCSCL